MFSGRFSGIPLWLSLIHISLALPSAQFPRIAPVKLPRKVHLHQHFLRPFSAFFFGISPTDLKRLFQNPADGLLRIEGTKGILKYHLGVFCIMNDLALVFPEQPQNTFAQCRLCLLYTSLYYLQIHLIWRLPFSDTSIIFKIRTKSNAVSYIFHQIYPDVTIHGPGAAHSNGCLLYTSRCV